VWIDRNGALWGVSRGGKTSAFASDWKDKSTYVRGGPGGAHSSLSGDPDVEDPFVFQDDDDHFHQLIHSLEGPHMCGGTDCFVGVHAYSLDGVAWLFGGEAFRSVVNMTDGGTLRLNRRERPHLALAEGTRRPVGLITSAEVGGRWGDRSFTRCRASRSIDERWQCETAGALRTASGHPVVIPVKSATPWMHT